MQTSFIFGGDTGLTPEGLARERRLADALMARGASGGSQNAWEGMGNLAHAIAGKVKDRRVSEKEAAGRRRGENAFREALSALSGGMEAATGASPASGGSGGSEAGFDPAAIAATLDGDANIVGRSGGSRSWRNANPGNLEYGPFAKANGAIGTDGRFAIFPDEATGRAAMERLLFESSSYKNRDLASALNRYAPPSENDTGSYVNFVAGQAGVAPDAVLGSLESPQRSALVDAMIQMEGWKPGTTGTPMQTAQMAQGGGASLPGEPVDGIPPAFLDAMASPWLTDSQRNLLGVMLQQQLASQQPAMTPYQAAQLSLAERRLAAQLDGRLKTGTTVNVGQDGNPYGNPPKGHSWLRDAEGKILTEPDPSGRGMRPVAAPVGGTVEEYTALGESERGVNTANTMLGVIDGIIGDDQLKNATGWGSYVPFDLPGLNARVRGRIGQLEGQLFLQAFESLKGAGQITEVEGRKATEAMARLRTSLKYEDYIEALGELKEVVTNARDRANEALPEDRRWKPDTPSGPERPAWLSEEDWQLMTPEERREFVDG
ncbi:MAG: hypothetical protein AAF762_00230 [Pseudomonadota bacterium]